MRVVVLARPFLSSHHLPQSCDDFLSPGPLAATSQDLGEGKGLLVSDDLGEGKGVMVEWCRFRNCSLSTSRVSSSLPLPQSSISRISACLAGGCPVAFTRDVFPSSHRLSRVARDLPDSSHTSFEKDSKETLPSSDSVGKEWDDLVLHEGVTFIVVPYRNRTKALGLLVRVAAQCCCRCSWVHDACSAGRPLAVRVPMVCCAGCGTGRQVRDTSLCWCS